jgi:hypothetical protein
MREEVMKKYSDKLRGVYVGGVSVTIVKVKMIEKDLGDDVGPTDYLRIWFKGIDMTITYDWECHKEEEEELAVKAFKVGDTYRITLDGTYEVEND